MADSPFKDQIADFNSLADSVVPKQSQLDLAVQTVTSQRDALEEINAEWLPIVEYYEALAGIGGGGDPTPVPGDVYMTLNGPAVTVQTGSRAVKTAAGVYDNDEKLLKTLWRRRDIPANGSTSLTWDYLDDMGNIVADGAYKIKVLAHNIDHEWQGVIGNSTNPGLAGSFKKSYNMGGVPFTFDTVQKFYRGLHQIVDMKFGPSGICHMALGYNEAQNAMFRADTTNMKQRTALGHDDLQRVFDLCATDGVRGYFANIGSYGADYYYQPKNFIVAFDANNAEVVFPNGAAYEEGLGYQNHWTSVIDNSDGTTDAIQGIAVEVSGDNLYVAHKTTGIKVFNKTTGAFIRSYSVPNPSVMAIAPNGNLYVVVNGNEVRRYPNPATATTHDQAITGFGKATAIGISPLTSTVAVLDSAVTIQQVKGYSAAGVLLWTHGQQGGYTSNGVDVNYNKFNFNDNPSAHHYLAFEPANNGQEFFWVGEPGNFRNLKFRLPSGASGSNPLVYVDQIAFLPIIYKSTVDTTNPTRVFAGWLEFAVDYSKPITESWTLVKNWGVALSTQITAYFASGLQAVFTSPQGRTYATGTGANESKKIYELTSSGLRDTGITVGNRARLHSDGSLRYPRDANGQFQIVEQAFNGVYENGNPQYGSETVVASAPKIDARGKKNPYTFGAANDQLIPKTSTGLFVTFNPSSTNDGTGDGDPGLFHLGALKPGNNVDFAFRASPAGAFNLSGNKNMGMIINADGTFNIADTQQPGYCASIAMAVDRQVVYNYYGEFWNGGEANQWMHWLDNGLFIGQFGIPNYSVTSSQDFAAAGVSGNTFSSSMVKMNGNIYIYSNDESAHGGIHRWRVTGLDSMQEMVGNVGRNASVTNPNQISSTNIS